MTFRPAHRKNPLDRQVLGVRKPPPSPAQWLCVGCGKPSEPGHTCECGTTAVRSAPRKDSTDG